LIIDLQARPLQPFCIGPVFLPCKNLHTIADEVEIGFSKRGTPVFPSPAPSSVRLNLLKLAEVKRLMAAQRPECGHPDLAVENRLVLNDTSGCADTKRPVSWQPLLGHLDIAILERLPCTGVSKPASPAHASFRFIFFDFDGCRSLQPECRAIAEAPPMSLIVEVFSPARLSHHNG